MQHSIGLITLNAKFIHASLGLRYLRNVARDEGHKNVWIKEFVINQPVWKIANFPAFSARSTPTGTMGRTQTIMRSVCELQMQLQQLVLL